MDKVYIAIDLKSFYASVECHERGLDPLTTNLVVADSSRTLKTICLAVSPSLKSYGIGGRERLFEVQRKVSEVNRERKKINNYRPFKSKSFNNAEIVNNNNLELDFIIAKPRMSLYIKYSTKIYNIYLKYIAKEDIHVYSIDEVFMDVTNYLNMYKMNAHDLAMKIIQNILSETGITATAGIGTNLYLSKVAMDIVAKHIKADNNGVRIAYLDEISYRKELWDHTPITDFWRVGKGYAKKLLDNNLYTMGDIARCSLGGLNDKYNEELLYKLFGVNAEILIDHAWGIEPCSIKDIKKYKPRMNSISSGQVLMEPYTYLKAKIIVKEMTDLLCLDLVKKNLVCNKIALTIIYDRENIFNGYNGEIKKDYYGREIPKESHKSISFENYTCSMKIIMDNIIKLYDDIVNNNLLVRKIYISFNVIDEDKYKKTRSFRQLDLFNNNEEVNDEDDKKVQEAILSIKKKYGKNSIFKGMDLEEGATTILRNKMIGGHHE